ncbi:MAG: hypothetical protein KAV87_38920 [Desulfobacteraceae bacterium]|nr:hypothetical protein [Desulfobacteraceae bacterium]
MAIPVKLKDIIDGMEFQSDEIASYLNKRTGEVVTITDEEFRAAEDNEPIEDFPKWQHENIKRAREVLETDDYISLPSKSDIHEYEIMERFCLSITDDEIRERMYRSIKGSGAFRRFKDNIQRNNRVEDWYKYREEAIKQIAIDWCEENDIEFTEQRS